MNITITGNLGSGKTSVCRELEKSGFQVISAGDIFRDIAAEKGMTVIELNEAAKKDRSIDDMLDQRSTELGKKMDNTVFDSRLAWHFVENSFKVFLLVDTQEAARRVFAGDNRSAEEYHDIREAAEGLRARAQLEKERFFQLYGLDYYDASNYDLIIESSEAAPQQIAQEIRRNFELYQAGPFLAKLELNLRCLYPGKGFEAIRPWQLEDCLGREQERSAKALCAKEEAAITIKDGYNYIAEGHHGVLAAIAAGRIFVQIKELRMDQASREAVKPLSKADLDAFERAGKFHYKTSPVKEPEKTGYMLDFSGLWK